MGTWDSSGQQDIPGLTSRSEASQGSTAQASDHRTVLLLHKNYLNKKICGFSKGTKCQAVQYVQDFQTQFRLKEY
jgi:hypothetical protein